MKYRPLGRTGLTVSEIGFGGSRIGGVFAASRGSAEAIRALRGALDAGITFYDTADLYSQGESEALMGQAFRDQREKVIIASKGGYCLPAQRQFVARIKPLVRPLARLLGLRRENLPAGVTGTLSQDFSPGYLRQAVEGSLRRLQTDYLDLYQLHSPPSEFIQSAAFSETLEALETLKQQGKIRYYGVAADTPGDAALCLHCSEIASVQLPFGLLDLEALDAALAAAQARGVGVIARGCFGGGLLKASLTEAELKEKTPKWPQVLAYRRLAEQQGRPILELALQFVLRAPAVSVTLLGMRTETHLTENLRCYTALPLTEAEYSQIMRERTLP